MQNKNYQKQYTKLNYIIEKKIKITSYFFDD